MRASEQCITSEVLHPCRDFIIRLHTRFYAGVCAAMERKLPACLIAQDLLFYHSPGLGWKPTVVGKRP